MHWRSEDRRRKGAALVEFALIALVLTLLLAATIDFGRAVNGAQIIQQAADVGCRELARVPLPPLLTFEGALAYTDPTNGMNPVKTLVYDDSHLTVQLQPGESVFDHFANGPIINKLLAPLMIVTVDQTTKIAVARYPGVVDGVKDANGRYQIPLTLQDNGTPTFVNVVEEIKPDASDSTQDPFSLASAGTLKGYVALRINYPFQAAGLVAYKNAGASDFGGGDIKNVPIDAPFNPGDLIGPYGGADGRGVLLANARTVRPFRRLLSAQAVYRREVFGN